MMAEQEHWITVAVRFGETRQASMDCSRHRCGAVGPPPGQAGARRSAPAKHSGSG
jgi:hypothetical protein